MLENLWASEASVSTSTSKKRVHWFHTHFWNLRWQVDSWHHQQPFSKIMLSDVSVKCFIAIDLRSKPGISKWWTVPCQRIEACSQDFNKVRKKYSDQPSDFCRLCKCCFKKFMEIYLLKAPLVNFQMNSLNTKNIFNVSHRRGEERLSLNSIFERLGVFVWRKC